VELKELGSAIESAIADSPQLRTRHLREFRIRFFDVRWIISFPNIVRACRAIAPGIGGVMVWLGLPHCSDPFYQIMQRVQARALVIADTVVYRRSLLAMSLSDDFSGPDFLGSSLVRALAKR